jgi:hypothetical protein
LGGRAGFPLYPACTGCVFVGGAWASFVSRCPPTKTSAAAAPGCRYNPCLEKNWIHIQTSSTLQIFFSNENAPFLQLFMDSELLFL